MTKPWTKALLALLVHIEMDARRAVKKYRYTNFKKEKKSAYDSIIYLVAIP